MKRFILVPPVCNAGRGGQEWRTLEKKWLRCRTQRRGKYACRVHFRGKHILFD